MNCLTKQLLAAMLAAGALVAYAPAVHAQATPTSLPGDPRLVVFAFDDNNSYPILTRIKSATTIALQRGEQVEGFVLGDTFSWEVEAVGSNVFIKPKFDNIATSAALVTNRRVYQFTLRSTTESGRWYQRVSFEYPQESPLLRRPDAARTIAERPADATAAAAQPTAAPAAHASLEAAMLVDLKRLNFRYRIVGDAPFKPIKVFDDGNSTWLQMPPKLQEQPALFILNEAGQAELVQWFPRGDYLEIKRTGKNLLLKLGTREVRINNERDRSRWSFFTSGDSASEGN